MSTLPKIGLFTLDEPTASLRIMAEDMRQILREMGYNAVIITKCPQGIADERADLLINFSVKDLVTIQRQAGRWWYCNQLLNVFTMSCETYTRARFAGMLASALDTPIICISKAIYDDLFYRGRELFNAASMRTIQRNMVWINYGVLDIFTFSKKTNLDAFLCPITRLSNDKRYEDHQEATIKTMALFHLRGYQPTTTMFLTKKYWATKLKSATTDGYEVKEMILDRTTYAQELQKYAFAIVTTHFESFGLYYIELLLSGVICIFTDYPWVHKLLPGYKYVCKKEDLPSLAIHLRDHYDEAFAYIESEVIPFIRQNYLLKTFAEKLLERAPSLPSGVGAKMKVTLAEKDAIALD